MVLLWAAVFETLATLAPALVPYGAQYEFDVGSLGSGWQVHYEQSYSHGTSLPDIRPGKGDCMLWGARRSPGDTKLAIAAVGRRALLEARTDFWENGAFWYAQANGTDATAGFAGSPLVPSERIDLSPCQSRMSWSLNGFWGGYRAGCTAPLSSSVSWKKVVMFGPCTCPVGHVWSSLDRSICVPQVAIVPLGVQYDYDPNLLGAGWRVHYERPYSHPTTLADVQPGQGECILYGARRGPGYANFAVAAVGRRKTVESNSRIWENGVFWYTEAIKSAGFAGSDVIWLRPLADDETTLCESRLSWQLNSQGGFRAGCSRDLVADSNWQKVVMFGPCPCAAQHGWVSTPQSICPAQSQNHIYPGVQHNFHPNSLGPGWKVHYEQAYHETASPSIVQPGSGECVLWGARRSANDAKLFIAAIGRRVLVETRSSFWENGVFWYTEAGNGAGFAESELVRSGDQWNFVDTALPKSRCESRLSWSMNAGARYPQARAGCTTGAVFQGSSWRKVVMSGPCPCAAGHGGPATKSMLCPPCAAGTVSIAGNVTVQAASGKCLPCATGTFATTTGMSKCFACPAGRVANATGMSTCFNCPATTEEIQRSECRPCRPGKFSVTSADPNVGVATCSPCAVGFHQAAAGSTQCVKCGPGRSARNSLGASSCLSCPAGRFSVTGGSATDMFNCSACAPGSFTAVSGSTSCIACSPGSVTKTAGVTACFTCTAGEYMDQAKQTQCKPCMVGKASGNGAAFCYACVPGRTASSKGSTVCSKCAKGRYADLAQQSACKVCMAGSIPNANASGCSLCGIDTYAEAGHGKCLECGFGTAAAVGSDSCALSESTKAAIFAIIGIVAFTVLAICLFFVVMWCRRLWARNRIQVAMTTKDEASLAKALQKGQALGLNPTALKQCKRMLTVQQDHKYFDCDGLMEIAKEGHIKFVRGSWLANAFSGHRLQRQQDLPKESFWVPQDLETQVRFRKFVAIIAVAHCWSHPVHPDPRGDYLQILRHVLQLRLRVGDNRRVEDIGLFYDYLSLPQKGERGDLSNPLEGAGRTSEEEISFKTGRRQIDIIFANQLTEVWLLRWTATGSLRSFSDRAWPLFEDSLASLKKDPTRIIEIVPDALDIADWNGLCERGAVDRRPPLTPISFNERLLSKSMTRSSDIEFLQQRYEDVFMIFVGNASSFQFVDMEWGDSDVNELVNLLQCCPKLEQVFLCNNDLTSQSALALAKAAQDCPSLKAMDLSNNLIDIGMLDEIAQAWEDAGKGRGKLRLSSTRPVCSWAIPNTEGDDGSPGGALWKMESFDSPGLSQESLSPPPPPMPPQPTPPPAPVVESLGSPCLSQEPLSPPPMPPPAPVVHIESLDPPGLSQEPLSPPLPPPPMPPPAPVLRVESFDSATPAQEPLSPPPMPRPAPVVESSDSPGLRNAVASLSPPPLPPLT